MTKLKSFFTGLTLLLAITAAGSFISCTQQEAETGSVPVSFSADMIRAFFDTKGSAEDNPDAGLTVYCTADLKGPHFNRSQEVPVNFDSLGSNVEIATFKSVPAAKKYTVTVSIYSQSGKKGLCFASGESQEFSVSYGSATPIALSLKKNDSVDSYYFVASYGGGLTQEASGETTLDPSYGTYKNPANFSALCLKTIQADTEEQPLNVYLMTDIQVTDNSESIYISDSYSEFNLDLGGHTISWDYKAQENPGTTDFDYPSLITIPCSIPATIQDGTVIKEGSGSRFINSSITDDMSGSITLRNLSFQADEEEGYYSIAPMAEDTSALHIIIDENVSIDGLISYSTMKVNAQPAKTLNIHPIDFTNLNPYYRFGKASLFTSDSVEVEQSLRKVYYSAIDPKQNKILKSITEDKYLHLSGNTIMPEQEFYWEERTGPLLIQYPDDPTHLGCVNNSSRDSFDTTISSQGQISVIYTQSGSYASLRHNNGNYAFSDVDSSAIKIGAINGSDNLLLVENSNLYKVSIDSESPQKDFLGTISFGSTDLPVEPAVTSIIAKQVSENQINVYYAYTLTESETELVPCIAKGTVNIQEEASIFTFVESRPLPPSTFGSTVLYRGEVSITDLVLADDASGTTALYALLCDEPEHNVYFEGGEALTSRGALLKLSGLDNIQSAELKYYGWSSSAHDIYSRSSSAVPIEKYTEGFCGLNTAEFEENQWFIGPRHFTCLKPKELTIADYGRVLDSEGDEDNKSSTTAKNRRVVFDLDASLDFEDISDKICYGDQGSYNDFADAYLTPEQVYGLEGSGISVGQISVSSDY